MVDYLCIIQARVNSSRLPGKIMLDLAGKTLLERVYLSVLKSKKISKIIFATSTSKKEQILINKLNSLNIDFFRGDLNNVLNRYYNAAKKYNAKSIIRVTADNPLTSGELIDNLIKEYENNNYEYVGYNNKSIIGINSEIFSFSSLSIANDNALSNYDKEHVTPYIKRESSSLFVDTFDKYNNDNISVTIDTLEEYININNFYNFCQINDYEPGIDVYLEYLSLNENCNIN